MHRKKIETNVRVCHKPNNTWGYQKLKDKEGSWPRAFRGTGACQHID